MLLMTAPHGARQQDEFRQMLTGLRTTLEQEVKARVAEASDSDWDAELSIIQTHAETSRAIGAAIARVDAGTYGVCGSCRRDIDELRLRTLPLTTECAGCDEVSSA